MHEIDKQAVITQQSIYAMIAQTVGRVSVPMWPFTLSGRLWIVALVGLYLTN